MVSADDVDSADRAFHSADRLSTLLMDSADDSADSDRLFLLIVNNSADGRIRSKRYLLYFGQQYTVDNILLHVLS